MDDFSSIAPLIGNLGFPIFVAVWLLWRSDRILRELTLAVRELTATVKDFHTE